MRLPAIVLVALTVGCSSSGPTDQCGSAGACAPVLEIWIRDAADAGVYAFGASVRVLGMSEDIHIGCGGVAAPGPLASNDQGLACWGAGVRYIGSAGERGVTIAVSADAGSFTGNVPVQVTPGSAQGCIVTCAEGSGVVTVR